MCVVFSTEPSWLELAKHDSGEYNNIPPCEILVGPLGNILSQVWSGNNISLNPPPAPALPGRGQRRGISPDIISCHINPGQGTVIVTFSLLSSHFQGNVGRLACPDSWHMTGQYCFVTAESDTDLMIVQNICPPLPPSSPQTFYFFFWKFVQLFQY